MRSCGEGKTIRGEGGDEDNERRRRGSEVDGEGGRRTRMGRGLDEVVERCGKRDVRPNGKRRVNSDSASAVNF